MIERTKEYPKRKIWRKYSNTVVPMCDFYIKLSGRYKVEVTQQWTIDRQGNDDWRDTTMDWDNAIEWPRWWTRLYRKLFKRSNLPKAKLISG